MRRPGSHGQSKKDTDGDGKEEKKSNLEGYLSAIEEEENSAEMKLSFKEGGNMNL